MRYFAVVAALMLTACNPPPPSYGPDPIEMMMIGRMMNPQPTYQMQTAPMYAPAAVTCVRYGNQTVCN